MLDSSIHGILGFMDVLDDAIDNILLKMKFLKSEVDPMTEGEPGSDTMLKAPAELSG